MGGDGEEVKWSGLLCWICPLTLHGHPSQEEESDHSARNSVPTYYRRYLGKIQRHSIYQQGRLAHDGYLDFRGHWQSMTGAEFMLRRRTSVFGLIDLMVRQLKQSEASVEYGMPSSNQLTLMNFVCSFAHYYTYIYTDGEGPSDKAHVVIENKTSTAN